MRFFKLRIAWSVGWAILCVLLCMLWSRSYWWVDRYFHSLSAKFLIIQSWEEDLTLGFSSPTNGWDVPEDIRWWGVENIMQMEHHVNYTTYTSYEDDASLFTKMIRPFRTEPHFGVVVPSWFVVGVSAGLALVPWIRHLSWRFSLRTLLISMAIVAVVMGLVLYAGRDPWFDFLPPE